MKLQVQITGMVLLVNMTSLLVTVEKETRNTGAMSNTSTLGTMNLD
ncbi:hypothetical protein [Zooshikella harenae]|uniref:Uncharacterized protein n=1 Tax=Zooshikella harenae TaxID=2827238 RepID=A0ABS5ZLJ4_9GAMM|nr:hypothetical protein [Zooshikella harenae]MBU2714285.1 hypothetical protein [Zooshikella harenae]